jgi:hypothetical protein
MLFNSFLKNYCFLIEKDELILQVYLLIDYYKICLKFSLIYVYNEIRRIIKYTVNNDKKVYF